MQLKLQYDEIKPIPVTTDGQDFSAENIIEALPLLELASVAV